MAAHILLLSTELLSTVFRLFALIKARSAGALLRAQVSKGGGKANSAMTKGISFTGDHFSQGKHLHHQLGRLLPLCDPPCEPRQSNAENCERLPGW